MKNQDIYQSEEFANAWNNYLTQSPDILRTKLMNKYLDKKIIINENSIVLDAGCGNGFFLSNIIKKNPSQVFACDISPKLIDISKNYFPEKVMFDVVDLSKELHYQSNYFNVIVCYNVLMELDVIALTLKEFERVLLKNGTIHIVVVHPLFQLFVINSEKQHEPFSSLKNYSKPQKINVNILKGFDNFYVFSRPISNYLRTFKEAGLQINELDEIFIPQEIAKEMQNPDLTDIPVFLYFKLEKIPAGNI